MTTCLGSWRPLLLSKTSSRQLVLKFASWNRRPRKADEQVKKLTSNLESVTAQVASLKSDLDAAHEGVSGLDSLKSSHGKELADLSSKLQAATAEAGSLKSDLDAARQGAADVEKLKSSHAATLADMNAKLQAASEKVDAHQAELDATRGRATEHESNIAALNSQLDTATKNCCCAFSRARSCTCRGYRA